jgi:hypothetical protein
MLPARKAIPPAAEASPRLALVSDTVSDWQAIRRPIDRSDNALHHRTIKWLATLPAGIRPIATGRLYPRIVNRIGDLWSQCEYTRFHFQSLLIDRRKRRKGFPSEVKAELEALQHYYFEHLSGLPALLWNAVPVNPPRIPDRAFAPYPDTTEIDILPL